MKTRAYQRLAPTGLRLFAEGMVVAAVIAGFLAVLWHSVGSAAGSGGWLPTHAGALASPLLGTDPLISVSATDFMGAGPISFRRVAGAQHDASC